MHAKNDIRLIKCFDGLHYAFEILDHIYSDLHSKCCKINDDQKNIVAALWQAWAVIDAIDRIREIVQAMPGLGKKNLERNRFLNGTAQVKFYRNYIQHLKSEILKRPGNSFPVWGTLSWVDGKDSTTSHMIILGTQTDGVKSVGPVFDTQQLQWASKVSLSIDGQNCHFDAMYSHCCEFRQYILPWLKNLYPGTLEVSDKLPIISMKFGFSHAIDVEPI